MILSSTTLGASIVHREDLVPEKRYHIFKETHHRADEVIASAAFSYARRSGALTRWVVRKPFLNYI